MCRSRSEESSQSTAEQTPRNVTLDSRHGVHGFRGENGRSSTLPLQKVKPRKDRNSNSAPPQYIAHSWQDQQEALNVCEEDEGLKRSLLHHLPEFVRYTAAGSGSDPRFLGVCYGESPCSLRLPAPRTTGLLGSNSSSPHARPQGHSISSKVAQEDTARKVLLSPAAHVVICPLIYFRLCILGPLTIFVAV